MTEYVLTWIQEKADVSKYVHLRGLKILDTYPRGPAEIDILVGADH